MQARLFKSQEGDSLEKKPRIWKSVPPSSSVFVWDVPLVCNPVMYMLALAFVDNAFENDFTGPEDIYKLIVPPETDRIRLRWKDSWAETPVFYDIEKTASKMCVS